MGVRRQSAQPRTSCTEYPQYVRLVEFTQEAAAIALEQDNEELQDALERLGHDLLEMA